MKSFFHRFWKIIAVFIILASVGIYWVNRTADKNTASAIITATVKKKDFIKTISSSGKTSAAKSVDLKFQTSGKLTWVGVKEGASVSAYQTLATLDNREVQKNLEKALRDYSNERNDFDEASQITYGIRKSDTTNNLLGDTIRRLLQKNQWDLEKAVLDVELKSIALEYSSLVTPIAGMVTHIDTPVAGVNITPATAVFQVVDPSSIVFEAKIDEVDVGTLAIGQEAIITLDAFPDKKFTGAISYISYAAETSTGGATVFPVKIAFPDTERLRIGLNGDVTIETNKQQNVLAVPVASIREDAAGKYVYRKTVRSTYEKVPVQTGEFNDDEIVVTSGLQENDSIVTKGFNAITSK